jgi:hypothetical protein
VHSIRQILFRKTREIKDLIVIHSMHPKNPRSSYSRFEIRDTEDRLFSHTSFAYILTSFDPRSKMSYPKSSCSSEGSHTCKNHWGLSTIEKVFLLKMEIFEIFEILKNWKKIQLWSNLLITFLHSFLLKDAHVWKVWCILDKQIRRW